MGRKRATSAPRCSPVGRSWVLGRQSWYSCLGQALGCFGRSPVVSVKPSIAVLPFDDYGGDAATARLADSLTEDIITDLSRVSEIDVIAHNSTEAYKGKPADVRQIGRDLSVRYVLEGSIQRQDERIRATAQLIDSTTGAHVWSESWDRAVQDVFAVQTEIADSILSQFEVSTGPIKSAEHGTARRKQPQKSHGVRSQSSGGREAVEPDR